MTDKLTDRAQLAVTKLAEALPNVHDNPKYTYWEYTMKCCRYREIVEIIESLTEELQSQYFIQEESC